MKTAAYLLLLLLGMMSIPASAAELVSIPGATLVAADLNDGDSFKVDVGGRVVHLRLYYVDCPETTTYGIAAGLERLREQRRRFGLKDLRSVIRFGEVASAYTRKKLSRPFTVHTSYARAPGRSAIGRFYAFIETQDGDDLGALLVKNGLARIHGKTRPTARRIPSKTVLAELHDLRDVAMLNRAGVWSETDPQQLIALRRQQRKNDSELTTLKTETDAARRAQPMDINRATQAELQKIPGIGPVLATKIIIGRPYDSIRDLLKISGIGAKKLAAIAPYVRIPGE